MFQSLFSRSPVSTAILATSLGLAAFGAHAADAAENSTSVAPYIVNGNVATLMTIAHSSHCFPIQQAI
ncbi:hypothetical protein JCM19235_5670 [Vibrio maritimus]|uniref:Uncharacterized protein n=1 Tax=Vibrio maritimus TaxID=990268 RepID=A0A090RPC6_9VIBR|nr:hypothetical protein JCM19235_5670 [Vibrio maritimus]